MLSQAKHVNLIVAVKIVSNRRINFIIKTRQSNIVKSPSMINFTECDAL